MAGEQQRGENVAAAERKGMSWLAMLTWIGLAFLLAGLVAYKLVKPFFHGG